MIPMQNISDVRDNLERKLSKLELEYETACISVTSSRQQAKLSRLATEMDKVRKGIEWLNLLAKGQINAIRS